MKRLSLVAALILVGASGTGTTAMRAQEDASCAAFKQLVKKIYNFDERRLTDKQKFAKVPVLDHFWKTVKTRRKTYLPCLRTALQDPKANPFFRYDGSKLLVTLDPSTTSKALQVKIYTTTDLDTVGPQLWMGVLAERGAEGFDISQAAEHWITDPKAHYTLPEHGDFNVDAYQGARFLYGSMNEIYATPSLLRVLKHAKEADREIALDLLASQATPEALRALKKVDLQKFPASFQRNIPNILNGTPMIEPRDKPQISRAEYLQAFNDMVKGNGAKFAALVERVSDGERDAVVVLQPEDLPLVRRVRRLIVASTNPHALEYYDDFTNIILALVWKSKPVI